MADIVIRTERLSKTYQAQKQEVHALDNLNLEVQQGEVFGYLGPNGAGKTTTIRLLLDLIRPTQGRATILGMDAQADSVELHRRIGYLPGELNLWRGLTGAQVIDYVARIRGGVDMGYMRELSERLEFDSSVRVKHYSSGNRRKLGLVLALMSRPEVVILDEPTNGLDPLMQQIFNQLMREIREEGRTVFLSSHVLSEVQAICDRVGILRSGQLKAVEHVSDLTRSRFHWVTLYFREPVQAVVVEAVPGVSEVRANGNTLRMQLTGDFDPLLQAVRGHYIVDIRTEEPTLEEIFLAFYGNEQQTGLDRRAL